MAENGRPERRGIGRGLATGIVLAAVAAIALIVGAWRFAPVAATPSGAPGPSDVAVASSSPSEPTASPAPTPKPTPAPTSVVVPAPLTGLLISPEAALRHPIAVMIDDHDAARPQSGFNAASIVFQAPAEGGIPRYMLVFQDKLPTALGPIRSSREYYIDWAAEWRAMYVHFGGSPQALETLRLHGSGGYVWNADGLRWAQDGYMWRIHDRPAPHNVYTDAVHLESLAARIGVPDGPLPPAWSFVADDTLVRPTGNSITVNYPYETITSRYDPTRNAYLRYINGSKKPQVDAADGQVVAPTNVVVLRMHFGPLTPNDPHHRLEASDIGHGDAWISTGGMTIHGTWKKSSVTGALQLLDASGNPATLQPGQTFIEVITLDYGYRIVQGKLPSPTPS